MFKFIATGYWLLATGLFLYSYTQVDLNLTLSQWSVWKVIQTSFQHVGWFNRPLSTLLYVIILMLLVACYLLLLRLIQKGGLTGKQFWQLVIPASVILLFSYNAFSYDLFNYMFDARIITLHQESPYAYKALDYPQDPWTNFMRWTHRTYPYGSVWLGLTVPLSFVGMQFFLPTLFLFKSLMVASFLGTVYFIGKILERISSSDKLFGMALFALNPLVVIESLVSAHNDIVMMFFALAGLYFLMTRRYIFALSGLLASAYIKFINDALPDIGHFVLPVLVGLFVLGVWVLHKKGKEINWNLVFSGAGLLMIGAMILASQRTELQPWYLVWVLPFVSLLVNRKALFSLSFVLSIGLLLHYIPFLYTGNWDPPIPTIKTWITTCSLILGLVLFWIFKTRKFE